MSDLLDDLYRGACSWGYLSERNDIECLVLDPIYRSTLLKSTAPGGGGRSDKWHNGYELSLEEMVMQIIAASRLSNSAKS
ncbi:hypothetical protein OK016_00730 [Vibrio chagasii]|nr:hypothetical protein [Vibrio chagasii]